jgi:hypothetical protein
MNNHINIIDNILRNLLLIMNTFYALFSIQFALRMVKPKGGSFTTKWDKFGNVISTLRPKSNTIGIILVIIGLGLHLGGSFIG